MTKDWVSPTAQKRYEAMGAADVQAGLPFHPDYETWPILAQHVYEVGRLSAVRRPSLRPLRKRNKS